LLAIVIIMLAPYGTMQDAVETMKLGAYGFMIKSVNSEGIDAVIARALDVLRLRRRLELELGWKIASTPHEESRGQQPCHEAAGSHSFLA
jgi:DNA-binding NtrC family response regulator